MDKQTIPTSMAPEVVIGQVDGNLVIKGWDEPQVVLRANPDDLKLEEGDDALQLDCRGDCSMRLPQGASLQIEGIQGNASLKYLEEVVEVEEVHGSLALRSMERVRLNTVHGELSAKNLAGDLEARLVRGNVSIRNVQGKCILDEVGGNLSIREVEYDVRASAGGNVRLRLNNMSGNEYVVHAKGNLHCHIPEDADLTLNLSSRAENIRVKLPDGTRTYKQPQCEITQGNGELSVELSAGGSLYLISQSVDWAEQDFEMPEDFSQQIAQQVQSQIQTQMENVSQQINDQIDQLSERIGKTGLPPDEIDRLMEQVRNTSEREVARAQEKMRRAQEKMERKLEAAQRRQEWKSRSGVRRSWSFETPPAAQRPEETPVSEQERLMILRMLEEKKISLEEADQLLSALEGNS